MDDLFTYLEKASLPVVMYGMGNGADKIIDILNGRRIAVGDFFASDGFVRGQSFHGKRVLSFSEVCGRYERFIILVSFGSCRREVLDNIYWLNENYELYAPDVPVCGGGLFDGTFYENHKEELAAARELFCDKESKELFDSIVAYRLSGKISHLTGNSTSRKEIMSGILHPERYMSAADLGAYTGDTVRELLEYAGGITKVIALEPDESSYKKLAYSTQDVCGIETYKLCAWSRSEVLCFEAGGNRNSRIASGGKQITADTLDRVLGGRSVDYIKYDVEGAEREALLGSAETIRTYTPELCVSLYHRSRDLFELPELVHRLCPSYKLYLRKPEYIPAWDLCLFAVR